jgi:hypothetical protein
VRAEWKKPFLVNQKGELMSVSSVRSSGPSLRMPCNEADAVRSACLNGKRTAIKMKVKTRKYSSPFFYE